MKLQTWMVFLALALGAGVTRGEFTFTVNSDIPDGNPVGLTSAGTVSGLSGNVSGLTVDLSVSGGFNGDLYAYLVAPNGTTAATLLGVVGGDFSHVGSGYNNITLSDAASVNIQSAPQTFGQPVTGTYQPVVSLSTFDGLAANGNWTLFIADQVPGGGQAKLNTWSLDITTTSVPEPDQVAAMALLSLVGLAGVVCVWWQRSKTVSAAGTILPRSVQKLKRHQTTLASCGFTVVVAKRPTESFATARVALVWKHPEFRSYDLVPQTLMVSLSVVMQNELRGGSIQRGLVDEDHSVQTRLLDGAHKSLKYALRLGARAGRRTAQGSSEKAPVLYKNSYGLKIFEFRRFSSATELASGKFD